MGLLINTLFYFNFLEKVVNGIEEDCKSPEPFTLKLAEQITGILAGATGRSLWDGRKRTERMRLGGDEHDPA